MGKTLMNYLMGERAHVLVSDGVFFVRTRFSLHLPKAYGFSTPDKFMKNFGMPVDPSESKNVHEIVASFADREFKQNFLRVDNDVAIAQYVSESGKALWINPLLLPNCEVSVYSEDESGQKPVVENAVRVYDGDSNLVAMFGRLATKDCEDWLKQ